MSHQPTAQRVTCCGGAFHEITVQSGGSTLSLYRCTSCDRQQWLCDGQPLGREAALERLASSYRRVPVKRTPEAATASQAARQAARREARAAKQATPQAAPPASPELVDLLEGWKVLGSTG